MNRNLRERYLSLFSQSWNHSSTRGPFIRLADEAASAQDALLAALLEARVAALENRSDEALERLEALLQREPTDPWAGLLKARILCLDRRSPQEALPIYKQMADLSAGARYLDKWLWSLKVAGEATALSKLKDFPAATERCDAIIAAFARARKLELRRQSARARLSKALLLLRQKQDDAAAAVLEEFIERTGNTDPPEMPEQAARALFLRGVVHGLRGHHQAAREHFERAIQQFGDSDRPHVQEAVLAARINCAVALRKLQLPTDAVTVLDRVVDRFGHLDVLEIQEGVAMALIKRAAIDCDTGEVSYWVKQSVPPHHEG